MRLITWNDAAIFYYFSSDCNTLPFHRQTLNAQDPKFLETQFAEYCVDGFYVYYRAKIHRIIGEPMYPTVGRDKIVAVS